MPEFWRFTINDMEMDINAQLSEIIRQVDVESVTYVGHSLGCSQVILGLSNPISKYRNIIASKIKKIYCMAPVVYTVRKNVVQLFLT